MAQNQKLRDQTAELTQHLSALTDKVNQLTARLAHQGEVMAAIVKHLGEDVVQKVIEDMRAERRRQHDEKLETSVKFMLDNELATPAPEDGVIGPDSFVVLNEVAPDGTATRAQHEMKRLDPEGQKRYFGKKVGDIVTNPQMPGWKVEVKAIYTIDMAKVAQFASKKKQEAAEKAAKEAAAAAAPGTNASPATPE